ncbi:DMT family transporter [Sorangium sp. So ce128]|uniref:DMT family transporter n=1 Tax=Sorangium sp. So ce128 TaxID=3133281 RepID=UPI003F60DC9D
MREASLNNEVKTSRWSNPTAIAKLASVSSMREHETIKGLVAVIAAASAWGTVPLFVKHAERSAALSPFFESFALMAGMTLASAPLALGARRSGRLPVRALLAVGACEALNVACLLLALRSTSVAVAMTAHHLAPILVALAAGALLGERLRGRVLWASSASLLGLALMLSPWSSAPSLSGGLFGLASAVFLASNVLLSKRLTRDLSGAELLFFRSLFALPLLALLSPRSTWTSPDVASALWLVVAGAGPGVLGGLLFLWGLSRVSAGKAATLTLLEPLVAIALSLALLGERPTGAALAGGLLILASAAAVLLEPPAPPAQDPEIVVDREIRS